MGRFVPHKSCRQLAPLCGVSFWEGSTVRTVEVLDDTYFLCCRALDAGMNSIRRMFHLACNTVKMMNIVLKEDVEGAARLSAEKSKDYCCLQMNTLHRLGGQALPLADTAHIVCGSIDPYHVPVAVLFLLDYSSPIQLSF